MTLDVIVLGLGAMGSAAAYHLAARGVRVLGIEQFTSPHDKGSSHGGSRMIRQAYFESPDYIPLVLRAYELWRRLEMDAGARLLHITGGLTLGREAGGMVRRTVDAAKEHGIPFGVLDGVEVRRRFPAITPLADDVGVLEPNAGYLLPEECIRAHLRLAAAAGAELHFEEKAIAWSRSERWIEVRTDRGTYEAGHLVITAGPWANEALAGVFPLRVTRQVMAWFAPLGGVGRFEPERFPVFLMEDPEGGPPWYGFPAIDGEGGGMKAAIHGSDDVCTPETIDRSIHTADVERIRTKLTMRIPALDGEVLRAQTCMYTMTRDEHFVIGAHPRIANCSVACGFSGHGFKFAPVVGEILGDLAQDGSTRHPIGLFDPNRCL